MRFCPSELLASCPRNRNRWLSVLANPDGLRRDYHPTVNIETSSRKIDALEMCRWFLKFYWIPRVDRVSNINMYSKRIWKRNKNTIKFRKSENRIMKNNRRYGLLFFTFCVLPRKIERQENLERVLLLQSFFWCFGRKSVILHR